MPQPPTETFKLGHYRKEYGGLRLTYWLTCGAETARTLSRVETQKPSSQSLDRHAFPGRFVAPQFHIRLCFLEQCPRPHLRGAVLVL